MKPKMKCIRCGSNDISLTFKAVELMTFFEAWEKAKDGDTVRHLDGDLFVVKGSTSEMFKIELGDIIDKRWKIIPAEPKVLSARDILNKFTNGTVEDGEHFSIHEVLNLIRLADQNGQLKMWLKFKKEVDNSNYSMYEVVENLKPLKAE